MSSLTSFCLFSILFWQRTDDRKWGHAAKGPQKSSLRLHDRPPGRPAGGTGRDIQRLSGQRWFDTTDFSRRRRSEKKLLNLNKVFNRQFFSGFLPWRWSAACWSLSLPAAWSPRGRGRAVTRCRRSFFQVIKRSSKNGQRRLKQMIYFIFLKAQSWWRWRWRDGKDGRRRVASERDRENDF